MVAVNKFDIEPRKPSAYYRKVRRQAWDDGYQTCLNDIAGIGDMHIPMRARSLNPYGSEANDAAPVRG